MMIEEEVNKLSLLIAQRIFSQISKQCRGAFKNLQFAGLGIVISFDHTCNLARPFRSRHDTCNS